jgi:hypothetical protein
VSSTIVTRLTNPGSSGVQLALDDLRSPRRLGRVVQGDVADQDVGVEADHRLLLRVNPRVAPFAIAASMSASEALLRVRSIPLSAETGSVGRIATCPSGWMKNLTLVAGFEAEVVAGCVWGW